MHAKYITSYILKLGSTRGVNIVVCWNGDHVKCNLQTSLENPTYSYKFETHKRVLKAGS